MRALLLAGAGLLCLAGMAHGATITFDTVPVGNLAGPVTESGFTFSVLTGAVYVAPFGNPGQNVEATGFDRGTLRIVAAGGTSAPFLFSGLDYGSFSYSFVPVVQTLVVTGLLGGAVVGTDSYTEPNTVTGFYTGEASSKLAGVVIDEIRIALGGGYAGGGPYYQAVDNVVLSAVAVPEAASLVLLGSGAAGVIAAGRRRRKAAAGTSDAGTFDAGAGHHRAG